MNLPTAYATDTPSILTLATILVTNFFMGLADVVNFFIQATPVLHFAVVFLSLVFLVYDRVKKVKKKKHAK